MRLIDADELLELYADSDNLDLSNYDVKVAVIRQNILDMPTIDLARWGEWKISSFTGNWYCNICGNEPYHSNLENMNYCPNCGAKMERRKENGVGKSNNAKANA